MEVKGGYVGNLLRVNLNDKTYHAEHLDEALLNLFLGGRGVAAKIYFEEIAPEVRPLDEANKLIFMSGPLTGTIVPGSTKFQCATKSPETGIYLCSNSGGDFGPQLKFAGYDGLIIEGRASKPVYLSINDDKVKVEDATKLWGKTTGKVYKILKEKTGYSQAGIMCVGPAAEGKVAFSCIKVDGRSFGRGGAGAVMASKNLKAIVVKGQGRLNYANLAELKKRIKPREVRKACQSLADYGRAIYTESINELGCYPVRNFQTAVFSGVDKIDARSMKENFFVKNQACFKCPVACLKVCRLKTGRFEGWTVAPEYETIWALGAQCGVSDFNAILSANLLCDEYGMDTISTGNIIGFAMELYERGMITREDTGGLKLSFGSPEAVLGAIELIANRKKVGEVLARGFRGIAAEVPGSERYMMQVKGMPFAAYDPRGFYGMGLTYGTSSRGACHNVGGWSIRAELLSGDYDRFALKGKGKLIKSIQDTRAYLDCLGICTVVRRALGFSDKPDPTILNLVTGLDFTDKLMEIGERIYNLERVILTREGIRRKDDMLPPRIMKEKLPEGPAKGHVLTKEMYEVELDEYYEARRWSKEGIPTQDKLEALSLQDIR
ncbi:aldehyde ferredoxin oxidoreductase [Candidatus Aerophobetes bacterium Ae_b3b]|nr:MAG: aldehyde ferredoxin oxidoreductase [Candidatus Aerophobetes bacterium Ae_b3b]